MKKIIIILAIILTSGLAAFAFTANKPVAKTVAPVQTETAKVQAQDGDMRANLATAD